MVHSMRKQHVSSVGVALAVFRVGVAGARTIAAVRQPNGRGFATQLPDSTREYLALVYIGKASCPVCRRPELKAAVRRARDLTTQSAMRHKLMFHSVGVSLDASSADGIKYLESVGPFHEVLAGGNWVGLGAAYFLWSRFGPPVSTPQLLIIRRRIELQRIPPSARDYTVDDNRLLVRRVGLAEIESWIQTGAPIPWGPEAIN